MGALRFTCSDGPGSGIQDASWGGERCKVPHWNGVGRPRRYLFPGGLLSSVREKRGEP